MPPGLQFDPALQQILRRSARAVAESGTEALARKVPVVARLTNAVLPVPHLDVVARFGTVVTGRVPLGRILDVRRHANVLSLKASVHYGADLAYSVPEICAAPSALAQPGKPLRQGRGVLAGFADWGIDFAHSNFRDAQGRTRFLRIWDQRGGPTASSPAPYGYGREWTREDIDAALRAPDPYAALGYDPRDADPGSGAHGTHVADICAGNGRAPGSSAGVAPEATLVFVHLKGEDTHEEDTLGDSVRLLESARYLADVAGDMPLVINLSLGRTGGPKDGTTPLESALDELLAKPGRAICMSTGNYQGADLASSGRLSTGESRQLTWRVTPRHDEFAEMEIWLSGSDAFRVELFDPSGALVASVRPGESFVAERSGEIIATVFYRRKDPNNGDDQANIFIWPEGPIGNWKVRLFAQSVMDGRFHAWIERDDPESQSRFAREDASAFCTIGTIVSGRRTIAVSAYDARLPGCPIVPFSSSGPSRDNRQVPVISAPGAGIRAARSSRFVGSARRHNETTVMSGTSMASPHVAGVVALMHEAAGARLLSAEEIRGLLQRTARKSPPHGPEERLRYGAGRVDAAAAVAAVEGLVAGESLTEPSARFLVERGKSPGRPVPPALLWLREAAAQKQREEAWRWLPDPPA
jgi:subtilisin family serine protease